MQADEATAYDAYPYPGHVYWFAHPDHMRVLAHFHGLAAAPASRCRVLELGCGDGGNLLPLAERFERSRFEGIDLAASHVARARDLAARVGLQNLAVERADVRTLEVEEGAYDYVIAHGLVSWIPPDAFEATLALVRRALAPNGVAMISFNAWPGWHDYATVRRFMVHHTAPMTEPAKKIAEARRAAQWFCARVAGEAQQEKGALVTKVHQHITRASDALVRHDYLAEEHHPFWFEDFMARADEHGLAFLCNARQGRHGVDGFDERTQSMLRSIPDVVRRQQYIDFFANTKFRTVLLVRQDASFAPEPELARASPLFLEARYDRDPWEEQLRSASAVPMTTPAGHIQVAGTPIRIVLSVLWRARPRAIGFDTLLERCLPELIAHDADGGLGGTEEGRQELRGHMVRELTELYFREVLHLWAEPAAFGDPEDTAPRALSLARARAAEGAAKVPSVLHQLSQLTPMRRALLARMDGRPRTQLLAEAEAAVHAAQAGREEALNSGGEAAEGPDEGESSEDALRTLALMGQLIAAPAPG